MRALFAVICLLACLSSARADEVTLRDGRVIEGRVVEDGDRIRVEGQYGAVTFDRSDVTKITRGPTRKEEYARRLAAIAEGDAQGHYQLAQWCDSVGLKGECQKELAACISLDPNHEQANRLLGRVRYKGKWMTPDEALQAQGMVKWGDRWIPAEEKALHDAIAEAANTELELRRRILDLTVQEVRGDAVAREEAEALLSKLALPMRAGALLEALGYPDAEVRAFAARGLPVLTGKDALEPLARRYLVEGDRDVLVALAVALHGLQGAQPGPLFANALGDRDLLLRMRAEEALAEFPWKDAAPQLVDMLENTLNFQAGRVTFEHQETDPQANKKTPKDAPPPPPPQPRPADSLSLMERERKCILHALAKITGVNMGLDIARWRVIVELIRRKDDQGK